MKPPLPTERAAATHTLSRRDFLRYSVLGAAGTAAAGYLYTNEDTAAIAVEEITAPLPGLPPAFHGYRIGLLTDIHLGLWLPTEWLAYSLDTLRKARIDLLILGGDYIFFTNNPVWRKLGIVRNAALAGSSARSVVPKVYNELTSVLQEYTFPDGCIAVAGNHDHWNSTAIFRAAFNRLSAIKLLLNEEFIVTRDDQRLRLFGVDDYLTGIPSLPPAWPHLPHQESRIIVSHNPDYLSALLRTRPEPGFDLAVCGHTHGGQIRLPLIGAVVTMTRDARFISGLSRLPNALVYTSRGLGVVGVPCRVNCPPEVTVITLVAQEPSPPAHALQ